MRTFYLRCLAILLALGLSTSVIAAHRVILEESHDDWLSLVVTGETGRFARAITFQIDASGEFSTFNVDSPASDCDTVVFSINVNLSEIQDTSIESPIMFGKFRVDRNPVHDFTYTLSAERGADYISLVISNWSRSDSLLREIMSGQQARFQFKIDDDAYYYRFSLSGSRAAITRQDNICRALGEDDEEYFHDDDEESDADYFEA